MKPLGVVARLIPYNHPAMFAAVKSAAPLAARRSDRCAARRSRPGSPNSTGMTTVNPASITRRAKVMTAGVMPGISAMTITAGPSPPV